MLGQPVTWLTHPQSGSPREPRCNYILWHPADDPRVEDKLEIAAEALQIFNQRFGAYPYVELDIVTQQRDDFPAGGGAGHEYSGLLSHANGEGSVFHALVHEVAHLWWFDLVGNDTQREPWLDEALANYASFVYVHDAEGEETARRVLDERILSAYDALGSRTRRRRTVRSASPCKTWTRSRTSASCMVRAPSSSTSSARPWATTPSSPSSKNIAAASASTSPPEKTSRRWPRTRPGTSWMGCLRSGLGLAEEMKLAVRRSADGYRGTGSVVLPSTQQLVRVRDGYVQFAFRVTL